MVVLPSPFSEISRIPLMYDRPSDVEILDRLTANLSCGATFWIKRDDSNSGLAGGGNKIRKLEYVLADALSQGADTLVTTGGIQSNHMRQTSAAAAHLGLNVALYPRDLVPANETEYSYAGNVQLNQILGAEVFPVGTTEGEVIEALRSRGRQPYMIPSGASLHPLGGLGYARAAFEILEQEKQLEVTFHTIITAVGSGSTLGGLVTGFKLAETRGLIPQKKRLLGFSIGHRKADMTDIVLRIARTAATKIGLKAEDITEDDFEISDEFLGDAYGVLNTKTMDGIKELARTEGILTDPVYTGKAFTGLLSMAKSGQLGTGNVLFLHTGGQVAMSAYPQLK
ncbi:unnamed protein product [Clonostachys rhizophaga]|uniref:Tryptophan synthase beta chain-like PALP domain-containing protein n=1 Tax=Clonostachys rhizophaga TaxID=160324 RepID=A0A9N9VR29_9HYPO|nr:unnamed protein product [Clonostachys rhizophaga]